MDETSFFTLTDPNREEKADAMLDMIVLELLTQLDFSISNLENYETLKEVFANIGESLKAQGLIHKYKVKKKITETTSGGVSFFADEITAKKTLGIDVSYHDLTYGIEKTDLKVVVADTYKIERMLADKLTSMLLTTKPQRIRDLYDFYLIKEQFNIDFNLLYRCIEPNNPQYNNIPFTEEVLLIYKENWDNLKVKDRVTKLNIDLPDFNRVIRAFANFIIPLKLKKDGSNISYNQWNKTLQRWE